MIYEIKNDRKLKKEVKNVFERHSAMVERVTENKGLTNEERIILIEHHVSEGIEMMMNLFYENINFGKEKKVEKKVEKKPEEKPEEESEEVKEKPEEEAEEEKDDDDESWGDE